MGRLYPTSPAAPSTVTNEFVAEQVGRGSQWREEDRDPFLGMDLLVAYVLG